MKSAGGDADSLIGVVTKLSHSVEEKVTAVTVPVAKAGDDDDDPMAASRARRKEAARREV